MSEQPWTVRDAEPALPLAMPEMVSIEIIPAGADGERCDGAVVRLIRDEGQPTEVSLASALGPAQCREIARQLLIVADAASGGAERTMLCTTSTDMWKQPGQALIVRCTPDPHFEFMVKPNGTRALSRPRRKLLVPGRS